MFARSTCQSEVNGIWCKTCMTVSFLKHMRKLIHLSPVKCARKSNPMP